MQLVKRAGHTEEYDSRKVYASVYSSCLNIHMHEGEAELIADKVSKSLEAWVKSEKSLTAHSILQEVLKELEKYSPDAAFMYKTHRDLS